MWNEASLQDLLSCRRRGWSAGLVRAGLRLAEPIYALAIAWRNRRYDGSRTLVQRVAVPVISVGNLTTGGTGKTPLVEWLARWFRQRGVRVTLISRGYGAAAGACNDEALELEQKLPDVPHLQNADRVAAALTAIEEFECQLLLLDDAFQHRRIHRDLDIVLIDALNPFGYGHLLPRGLLREPLSSLQRADVIALSRSDQVNLEQRTRIWDQMRPHATRAACVEVGHRPRHLATWPLGLDDLQTLAARPVTAFCGIGNPVGFQRTLEQCALQLVGFRAFPDHHPYSRADLDAVARWSRSLGAVAIVCTDKDLVKIRAARLAELPLHSLVVGMEVLAGAAVLEQRLDAILHRALGTDGVFSK